MKSKGSSPRELGAPILFQQVSTYVYQLKGVPENVAVYFVVPAPSKPLLTLSDSFNVSGSYVFVPANSGYDGNYIASIAQQINDRLLSGTRSAILHAFVWLNDPTPENPLQSWNWIFIVPFGIDFVVDSSSDVLAWGQLGLDIRGARVSLNDASDGFTMDDPGLTPGPFEIDLLYGGQSLFGYYYPPSLSPQQPTVANWLVSLPLTGAMAGSMSFALGFDYDNALKYFGLEFIYGYGSDNARSRTTSKSLRYRALAPPAGDRQVLTIQFYLNPILPFDPTATRFERSDAMMTYHVDPFNPYIPLPDISAPYFFTINGTGVTLQAVEQGAPELPQGAVPGSFAWSVAPPNTMPASSASGSAYYMSPVGCYKVIATGPSSIDLMPGLSALEFLRLQPGDLILFANNKPAYALGFGFPARTSSTQPLSNSCTTSWGTVVAPTSGPSRSYFSQPIAATYFAPPPNTRLITFLKPVQSKLWDFVPAPPPAPLFPIVPYGGIYRPASTKPPSSTAADRMSFEAAVLANQRHRNVTSGGSGPVFIPAGATQPSPQLTAAVTPQGLHVDLTTNGAKIGTWSAIRLAKNSPIDLMIQNPTAQLANVLTRDQLFLVVTNELELTLKPETDFQSTLRIADFNFDLDISPDGIKPPVGSPPLLGNSTILVVKLNDRQALKDLIASPSVWADADLFCPGAAAVSGYLNASIQNIPAPPSTGPDPFDYFRNEVISNPEWTGIIAFDALVDGNGMDPDFQMLLGGIDGDLRAHHIGVELNRIDSSTAALAFVESSLFGVIEYKESSSQGISKYAGCDDDVDYNVKSLIVAFRNSVVVLFQSTVELTIGTLFGRTVKLANPQDPTKPNTIAVTGRYQSHNGHGTVTFDNPENDSFAFVRQSPSAAQILDHIVVSRAQLVPSDDKPATITLPPLGSVITIGTLITCAFQLEGELFFTQAPFPGTPADSQTAPVDLFSYGTTTGAGGGMDFTGLSVVIKFVLAPKTGSVIPGSKTVCVDYVPLLPTPQPTSIRPDGFVNSLPLRFSRFVTGPDLAAAAKTAFPVNFAQLVDNLNTPPPPTTTRTPQFALEYDLSLGSLGKLADDQGGITAKLLLGWGPSTVSTENDAAAVLLQLPQLSAGTAGFNLMGVLKTQLGAGSLVRTTVNNGIVYAILFSNVQLSAIGLSFPPGMYADFILFAKIGPGTPTNVAWFLSATSQASVRKRKQKRKPKPKPKPRAKSKQKRHPKRKQHR